MAFYNQDERFAESESISTDYDRGYGYGRGPRDDERFTETQTTSYDYDYGDGDASDMPPPPQVPYPWRARWHAGRRTYEFINAETDERTFEFPGRRGYGGAPYEEQITTTTYVDEDAYRMAQDGRRVEGFPEEAARWAGERVQAVEDVPGDVEAGFDRLGRRVQRGYDDVVDAPEEVAGWVSRLDGAGPAGGSGLLADSGEL